MSEGKPGRKPTSIRGQLGLLFAALAIPLLVLQAWWAYHDYRSARRIAEEHALALADVTKLGVNQFLAQAEETMTGAAIRLADGERTGPTCDDEVGAMTELLPFLENAMIFDRDGLAVCGALDGASAVDASEWSWFEPVRTTGRFLVADPAMGDVTGSWILPLIAPIVDGDGAFAGAVVGAVSLVGLSQRFGTANLPGELLVTVATNDRVVVSRSHEAESWVGRVLPPDEGSTRFLAPGRSVATGSDLAGVERIWGQVDVGRGGWTVYVGVPRAAVFAPALSEARMHIGATLLVVILAMLFAGRSYARIGRALRQLARGTSRATEGSIVPLPAGTPAEVTAIVERFNETLTARDQARSSEDRARARFQSIFDNAVFGIYVSTPDGRFLQANPALVEMLGYASETDLLNTTAESLYATPSLRAGLVDTSLDSKIIPARELEWIRADSTPITVRLTGKVITGLDGEPLFEMIVQDITEERRTEDELRQTQKMEAVGKLAGGIAHDFNNLLTVIGGNVELLEEDLGENTEARTDLEQISKATHRAVGLTRRLLTFSRKQRRGERVLDINEVIPELEQMLDPLIGDNLRVETTLGRGPLPVSMDPGEFEQVVLNLVLNARDAMPRGGTVHIETRRTTEAECVAHGWDEDATVEGAVLSVSDTGVGMDEKTRPRIFEPFYTTKPMGEGTGLGLSTVYGIVKRAGGTIHVESAPGRGTCIEIFLTLADSESEREPPAVTERAPGGEEAILVVEDDELVRTFVRRALDDAGYRVHVSRNGKEALRLLRAVDDVDLILTDVVMPELSGPDLAEQLQVVAPGIPILFMSGYVDNPFFSEELERRPERLLQKPFSTDELLSRIRTMLDAASSQRSVSA